VRDILGYIQASIIVLYWVYGNWSTFTVILLPRYYDGRMPIGMLICAYLLFVLVHYLFATLPSVGAVP